MAALDIPKAAVTTVVTIHPKILSDLIVRLSFSRILEMIERSCSAAPVPTAMGALKPSVHLAVVAYRACRKYVAFIGG